MKKIIVTLILLSSTILFSQKKAKLGIKAGANYSTITATNLDAKMGLYAGLFLNIQVSDFYVLQPELFYSNQGGTSKSLGDKDIEIHYISLSLANKFFVMKDQRFHLIAGMGIDLDFDDNFVNFRNNGFNDRIFFMDAVFFGGLGYQFDIGLTIEARYKRGAIGVFTFDSWDIESNNYNTVFQFGMAYRFDFKKQKK